jgi:gas vesicle protein
MSDPDTIRAEIERTRSQLGGDVDLLAEKVSPSSIADRQKEKVKDRVRTARESVMGAAHDVADKLPSPGSAGAAGGSAVQTAKGHPMVVGLIAFGAGWLLSSLIPTAAAEKDLASTAKEKAAPLVGAAKDAAKDVAQNLKEPAQDAAAHLKDTAQDAASTVKEEGQSAASDVRSTAADAKDDVAGAARG